MENNAKIICFYTLNGIYPQMAERLKKSCDQHLLKSDIRQAEDLGSWVKNCGYKSDFIYERMSEIEDGSCLIWVDSDAVIKKHPEMLLSCKHDFAIHAKPGGRSFKPVGRDTIHLPDKWNIEPKWFESGTMFFRKTTQVMHMLDIWKKWTAQGNKWDQWTLQEAWAEVQPPTLWLPRSYCQIHKLHGDKDAVILHDLASVIQKVNRL
jgi:hypothetical protein